MTEQPETPRTPSTPSTAGAAADPTPEAVALEAEIERTREDLAETVDRLAAKLDLKTRLRQRAEMVKDRAGERARRLRDRATDAEGRPTGATIGTAALVAIAVALVTIGVRRRHASGPRGRRR
jgi:hypothetical protein